MPVTVSAPGRVNLIGEHTDYSLLPVLPMAIQKRLEIRARPSEDGAVEARSARFGGVFRSDRDGNPPWSRYLRSVVDLAAPRQGAVLTIDGDLPTTGGLSSSSALTVAALLAFFRLEGREPAPLELVDLADRAERATGTEGGRMDQTLIVNAVPGSALRIEFDPLSWATIQIPEHVAFVAGYSGSPAPKMGAARTAFNARVVGTRTAALLLGADRLGHVDGDLPDLIAALPEAAPPEPEAVELTSGRFEGSEPLPVRAWARHVLGEAARVDAAADALAAGDTETLGRLFDASHASLAGDFGVSTPGLDRLVDAARDAGAAGARLTGAGFGGWAIAVCERGRADAVAAAMESIAGDAFVAEPSAGAR